MLFDTLNIRYKKLRGRAAPFYVVIYSIQFIINNILVFIHVFSILDFENYYKNRFFVFIFDFNKTVWSWNCKLWNYSSALFSKHCWILWKWHEIQKGTLCGQKCIYTFFDSIFDFPTFKFCQKLCDFLLLIDASIFMGTIWTNSSINGK